MKAKKRTAGLTIFLFLLTIVSGSYSALISQTVQGSDETGLLLKEADEAYQNGNFKLAIEKYQKVMQVINDKKELALTKQELFQTMTSLALTYFTIQENAKAEKQLEDLIRINPNQELDPEFYPPKFMEIFRTVQKNFLGKLTIITVPAQAEITLDGIKSGPAPLTVGKIIKGNHQLKIELKGYVPVNKDIKINTGQETREEIQLQEIKNIVEKKAVPPSTGKKKKKLSPWIIVGGAAVVALAVVLLAGKKSEPIKQLQSMTFNEKNPVPIEPILPTYVPMNVSGIPAKIEKIDYRVVIEHPMHMEDLNITITGTDNQTLFNIWNRGQSSTVPTVISGSSNAFDNVPANGTWRLLVQNLGRNPGGKILEFTLKIYYFQ